MPENLRHPEGRSRFSQAGAGEYLFSRPGMLRLHAKRDGEIVVDRWGGNPRFWTLMFGVAASVAMYRSGCIPLHASAVEWRGSCMALAGQASAGKSTLAASLVQRGLALFTDDLCLIKPDSGGPLAGAGFREIRLRDDAAETLGWPGMAEPMPDIAKAVYRLDGEVPHLLPLRRIYVLQFADAENLPGIRRIGGVEALRALVGCLRMRLVFLPAAARRRTFETLATIANAVELYRFVRPCDPAQLRDWTDRLAAHLSA